MPRPRRLSRRRGCAAAGVLALVSAAAAAAAPPAVVPWLDQRPVRAAASPRPAPLCRAGDLRARLFLQGATGSLVGGVDLLNAGSLPCALVGWPEVALTGAAAAATGWQVKRIARAPTAPDALADPPGSLRALAPGKSATLSLFWSNWCGPGSEPAGSPGTPPDGITLILASRTRLTVPVTQAPRCDAQQYPSRISVGPFTPTTRRLPQSSRLPLHVAIVGERPVKVKPGVRAFRVRRGELLRYEVAVTNVGRRAFRFAPTSCPVYIESLTPAPAHVYVLNCRPVGAIAPHARVLFAMQITVPATARLGTGSLTWELAPRTYEAPFAPAALWVVP